MEPNTDEDDVGEESLGPKSWSNFTVDDEEEDHACFLLLSIFVDMVLSFAVFKDEEERESLCAIYNAKTYVLSVYAENFLFKRKDPIGYHKVLMRKE